MATQPQQAQQAQPPQTPESFARVSESEQADRLANAASFVDIPREQIPGDAMTQQRILLALKCRALSGYDCYAYRPAHQEAYVIWDRQPNPATDARFTPRAWAIANGYLSTDGQEVR